MKRIVIVGLVTGCSALFGIDKIPYDGPDDGSVPEPIALSVTIVGQGSGAITDSAGKINCIGTDGTSCGATYDSGTSVSLTSTAHGASVFEQWAGACSGSGTSCVLVGESGTVDVVAEFENIPVGDVTIVLQPLMSGSGSGSYITSTPTPDNCGSGSACDCDAGTPCTWAFPSGTASVEITAISGCRKFVTFKGADCATADPMCTVVFGMSKSITIDYTYTMFGNGSQGSGTCD